MPDKPRRSKRDTLSPLRVLTPFWIEPKPKELGFNQIVKGACRSKATTAFHLKAFVKEGVLRQNDKGKYELDDKKTSEWFDRFMSRYTSKRKRKGIVICITTKPYQMFTELVTELGELQVDLPGVDLGKKPTISAMKKALRRTRVIKRDRKTAKREIEALRRGEKGRIVTSDILFRGKNTLARFEEEESKQGSEDEEFS